MAEVNFVEIEKKWQKEWEKSKIFEVQETNKKKKFYNLEMFPYPSGSGLHMGHALNYTIGDVYARFKRMQGFNVLYPMGYDAFGLPAENAAIKAGEPPSSYTKNSMANFTMQQKALGLSYDWSRKVATCDPEYYKWNQYFFLQFLKKGLVERKKAAVNWCPKCETVLANEQVHSGKCWRHEDTDVEIKQLEQWFIKTTKYSDELLDTEKLIWPERIKLMQENWIGKSHGTEVDFEINNPDKKAGNVIIVHGANENEEASKKGGAENTRHWHPWLKKKLEENKIKVSGEFYPKDWNPDYHEWKKLFEKSIINESTVLIGHSAGCAFILRWLEETKKKVKKVILVAPYVLKTKEFPGFDNLVKFNLDRDINKYSDEFIIFYSDNDYEFITNSVQYLKGVLDGNFIEFKGAGHFCKKNGFAEFPELLEQIPEKWPVFTTRVDTLFGVTFMVVSAQHPRLMELVTAPQKKEVDKFLRKLKSTSEKEQQEMEKEGVFTGSYAVNPATNQKIPVWAANFVVAEYGSGMVMADAHDQRDLEFAHKYKINLVETIISEGGKSSDPNRSERAFTDYGVLVKSGEFSGLKSKEAIEKITTWLEKKRLGKKTVNYKFRDWLVSRQRYWGTPIPVVYCGKCGIVPVPEKDLPVLLPEKVKFGEGNPLATAKSWLETKCPRCDGKARRETDTMDTFFDSSWYYLRYCDNENKKKAFDIDKVKYWMPVDQYIGGAEHACMHLIYARFFTKALRDMKMLNFDEPFIKLFNQGMLHGSDGNKMSKSLGNVINPIEMIEKYSADSLRMNLMSLASPDKDSVWNDNSLAGSFKFVSKVFDYFSEVKPGKSDEKVESKINLTIKNVTEDIENFRYNLAIIKLRSFFDYISDKSITRKDLESFVKMISVFCPHIAEEIWHKLGNKSFISVSEWPKADEKKINLKFEEEEKQGDKLVEDINNIVKIMKERSGKEVKKAFIYTIPPEKTKYNPETIAKRTNLEVKIFAVNDKEKYDPEGKAGKAKPGKPAIFLE